jgi:VIT1/CCC1 family predicted Fe2+/Mn2+ transporter
VSATRSWLGWLMVGVGLASVLAAAIYLLPAYDVSDVSWFPVSALAVILCGGMVVVAVGLLLLRPRKAR